jgi:DNA-binding GntR family transcriptional regulator
VRRSSGEDAALHIRRLIFDGTLRPGDRVPQDEIAQTLGLSRIPIREALIALEREGWVTIELHRGAFVNALDEPAVRDHYDLFALIYGFAVRRATARDQAGLSRRLHDLAGRVASCDDPAELQRLVLSFHATIVDTAASPQVAVLLRAMSGLVPGNFFALVPGAAGVERAGLTAIARAVAGADGDRASEEYVRMMQRQGELVVELFQRRGLFDD